MDFGNMNDISQAGAMPQPPPPAKKGTGWKILWAVITGFSVLTNVILFFVVVGAVVLLASSGGRDRKFSEEVIETGPRLTRIAVVSVDGIIDQEQAQNFYWQMKTARDDKSVKGLIVRVNSPGGTLSGSDEIYNEITKYRSETGKPVVAFMKGVAASGGYYTSVACDKIIAEPTTITGSIGVILDYFVLQQLLEEKLGIQPVVVKAGARKDWPSPFQKPSDEQLQYLHDRLIDPAYKRFVGVVAEGRKELTVDDVTRLADGSIYWADEALKEKLIDKIGYIKDAIKEVKSKANIEKAQVIEYRKTFSLSDILSAKTSAKMQFDRKMLNELAAPQVLYLWTGPQ
jgi:protease-4